MVIVVNNVYPSWSEDGSLVCGWVSFVYFGSSELSDPLLKATTLTYLIFSKALLLAVNECFWKGSSFSAKPAHLVAAHLTLTDSRLIKRLLFSLDLTQIELSQIKFFKVLTLNSLSFLATYPCRALYIHLNAAFHNRITFPSFPVNFSLLKVHFYSER